MTVYNCMLASSELEVTITKFPAKCSAGAVVFLFFCLFFCFVFFKNYIAMFAITIFGVIIEKHLDRLLCE